MNMYTYTHTSVRIYIQECVSLYSAYAREVRLIIGMPLVNLLFLSAPPPLILEVDP